MAELFGRKTGYCMGKGGSMHIADMEKGILGVKNFKPEHVPRCIWSLADIGAVGLIEEEAMDSRREIKIGRSPFSNNGLE